MASQETEKDKRSTIQVVRPMNYVHVGLSHAKVCGSTRERRCVCIYGMRVGAVVIQRV